MTTLLSALPRAGRTSWPQPRGWRAATLLLPVALLLSLVSCAADRTYIVIPATADTAALERQTYAAVNEYRVSKGRRALAWSDEIASQAREHSRRMARGATGFGHSGFKQRAAAIRRSHAWRRAGENVAINRTAAGALERWLKSRGHRRNIEGDFDLTGVGTATARNGSVYFTQIFIKSR